MKNNFSENCQEVLGEFSEYFRFRHVRNYLITRLLMPYREILSPHFLCMTSQARSVLQNLGLSISQYRPHIWLINSIFHCLMLKPTCSVAGSH